VQPKSTENILTMALHDAQELDDDLGGRADEHLALAATLGIDDVVEAVVLRKPSTPHQTHMLGLFHSQEQIRGPFLIFLSVDGARTENGGRKVSKDARAQNECRATESTSQTGLRRRAPVCVGG
jgi:hypothetical protein